MSKLTFYPCGGFGLNVLAKFKREMARTENAKNANIYGIDFSTNNLPEDGCFEVMTKQRGSGKYRGTNVDGIYEYVESFMTKYKPSEFNIVVFSTSGGSGSMLGPSVVRWLLMNNYPVVCLTLDDTTSDIENENSVKTYMTLDNIRMEVNKPIIFHDISNKPNATRFETDLDVCTALNLLSLMLDDEHGELDYEDISNFLNFSKVVKVNPLLSRITIFDQEAVKSYNGQAPVATLSMFSDKDSIKSCWFNAKYRATGVFKPETILPKGMTEFHAILDYGDTVKEIMGRIEDMKMRENNSKMELGTVANIGSGNGGFVL